jgi:hypothetical protein
VVESFDTLPQFASEGFQVGGWNVAKGTAEEFLFEGVVFSAEVRKLLGRGGGDFLLDLLLIRGDAKINFGPRLALPLDEGGFGDAKLAANAGKAQALDAKAEELVFGGLGVHGGMIE